MIGAPLVILGQVFAAAFAGGLNLYLTVALIGLTSRLGLIPALPPALMGLENVVLLGSALALYLIEFRIDKIPHLDSIWDALHTVIRPLGAALLTALALDSAPLYFQFGASLLAGVVALGAHGTKAGLRIILNASPSKWRNSVISTLEDVCAAALAIVALGYPMAALPIAAGVLVVLVLAGPRLWRAGALAVRAMDARLRGFFGSRGWHSLSDVPAVLRSLVEQPPLGRGEPRAVRAALTGLRSVGAYRNGWLVLSCDRTVFLYRSLGRPRCQLLPSVGAARLRRGLWTDALDFEDAGRACTLFLLKDGPSPDIALADLSHGGP